MIKKVKNTVLWTYVVSNQQTFYEKELPKTNLKEFGVEKVTKRKGDKNVKWKSCDSSFNSWIDKKDIV